MVKIIAANNESRLLILSKYELQATFSGVVVGFVSWLLTIAFSNFLTLSLSASLSVVAATVIGIWMMILLKIPQPLIVAVAASAALWGIVFWAEGLSLAGAMIWHVALYALAYTLFSWITRYARPIPVIASVLIIIAVSRIVVAL
ncbi:MAG: hypothetical protein WCQ49_01330 [Candidatus Saccharibacteria bacterium]